MSITETHSARTYKARASHFTGEPSPMGYTLRIGPAACIDDGERVYIDVLPVTHREAPDDGRGTRTNTRSPSYGGWDDFCSTVDLKSLFYAEDGLIIHHPGCVRLTQDHLDEIMAALARARASISSATLDGSKSADHPISADINRLEWLKYWMTWALKQKSPVIVNS